MPFDDSYLTLCFFYPRIYTSEIRTSGSYYMLRLLDP